MRLSRTVNRIPIKRTALATMMAGALFVGYSVLGAYSVSANHPVLVEGNCNNPPAGNSGPVAPGTCGDYDGDGRIGTAEDTDGDRVFGTIRAAVGVAGGTGPSINQNGTVTIVTSGTFPESVTITGNVTLQAAPGVDANLDAVLQGDPGSTARQGLPGIIVNSPANRYVVIRNILSKNWTSGIQVNGDSRVAIESCRLENNVNYGVEVNDNARVTVAKSEVHATGFRLNPVTGDFPTSATPAPGNGIEFDDNATGTVFFTTVSGSFGAGIAAGKGNAVCAYLVNVFDNNPNFENVRPSINNCGSNNKYGDKN